MSERSEALLREALTLPTGERADVAAELLTSLDDPPVVDPRAVEDAWTREIEARARRAVAGGGESWSTVRARAAQRLANP